MNIVESYLKGEDVWINPVGGLGDVLIASSIMTLVNRQHPEVRFNVVKRHRFTSFFEGHPAVKAIGHPPLGSRVFGTLFWQDDDFFPKEVFAERRPYQVMARKFGLEKGLEETLYYHRNESMELGPLSRYLSSDGPNILISTTSDCPRKQMHPARWEQVVDLLNRQGARCIQVGLERDPYVPGCVSFIGLTNNEQLYALINKVDIVVTADSFIMHLAKAANAKCVVIWGPTTKEMYGYQGHQHISAPKGCEVMKVCIGSRSPFGYRDECDRSVEEKCMNCISTTKIYNTIRKELSRKD